MYVTAVDPVTRVVPLYSRSSTDFPGGDLLCGLDIIHATRVDCKYNIHNLLSLESEKQRNVPVECAVVNRYFHDAIGLGSLLCMY